MEIRLVINSQRWKLLWESISQYWEFLLESISTVGISWWTNFPTWKKLFEWNSTCGSDQNPKEKPWWHYILWLLACHLEWCPIAYYIKINLSTSLSLWLASRICLNSSHRNSMACFWTSWLFVRMAMIAKFISVETLTFGHRYNFLGATRALWILPI